MVVGWLPDMIEAYPLCWPSGWKRTPPGARKYGRFSVGSRSYMAGAPRARELTVSDGVERVFAELRKMGIHERTIVISTNVRPTLAGIPRSGEKQPADPGAAVYWQEWNDAKRVMAIDIYTKLPDNLGAIAATLDAMRAIERHGGAQVLERAFTGFVALPAPGAMVSWRDVLGVGNDCTVEEARRAFRVLASAAHPDKGGAHDAMSALNKAMEAAEAELRG